MLQPPPLATLPRRLALDARSLRRALGRRAQPPCALLGGWRRRGAAPWCGASDPGGGSAASSRAFSAADRARRGWDAGGAAAGGDDGGRFPGAPEILFEDILPRDAEGGDFDWEEVVAAPAGRPAPRPAPLSDEALAAVDASGLSREVLVWAVGRAATLRLQDERLWRGFGKALAAIGEVELTPSEMCRLMQALGYAPPEAPLDQRQLQRLLKAFAAKAAKYSDEQIMRIVYGYSKLAAKRRLSMQRFLDFATSEVAERTEMPGWRKLRILQAVAPLPGATRDFKSLLATQVLAEFDNLDTESIRVLVPLLVELGIHERAGVVDRLNKLYKRKVLTYKTPDLILRSGLPLLLHDLLTTKMVAMWLVQLYELRIPVTADMVAVSKPMPISASGIAELAGVGRHRRQDDRKSDDAAFGNGEFLEKRATANLEALKMVELCLRHERPEVLASLSQKAQHLLTVARRTPLAPPQDFGMLELPFVFAGLGKLFRSMGVLLHPTVYGPYLLELADPLSRVVVEWDTNWELYPPWRRFQHAHYVRRKHLHLRAEGWQVLHVPLAEFQALADRDAQLAFLERFVEDRDLERLRVPA